MVTSVGGYACPRQRCRVKRRAVATGKALGNLSNARHGLAVRSVRSHQLFSGAHVVGETMILLDEDGLIRTRRGVGQFVSDTLPRIGIERIRPFEEVLGSLASTSGSSPSGAAARYTAPRVPPQSAEICYREPVLANYRPVDDALRATGPSFPLQWEQQNLNQYHNPMIRLECLVSASKPMVSWLIFVRLTKRSRIPGRSGTGNQASNCSGSSMPRLLGSGWCLPWRSIQS